MRYTAVVKAAGEDKKKRTKTKIVTYYFFSYVHIKQHQNLGIGNALNNILGVRLHRNSKHSHLCVVDLTQQMEIVYIQVLQNSNISRFEEEMFALAELCVVLLKMRSVSYPPFHYRLPQIKETCSISNLWENHTHKQMFIVHSSY